MSIGVYFTMFQLLVILFIIKLYARNNTFKSSGKMKCISIDESIQIIFLKVREKLNKSISVKVCN